MGRNWAFQQVDWGTPILSTPTVRPEPKWICYSDYTNVANENCVKFCMKEVFKCRERRMMWWDEVWTKDQAWGCPCHPKKYPRGTSIKAWGCPEASPSSSTKYQVIFQCAIFLLLHILCAVLGASFVFVFSFFFAVINSWILPFLCGSETRSI